MVVRGFVDLLADDDRADLVFNALGDATRRDIVRRSLAGEQSVSALARSYPMSLTAVQKHVAVLERAGLVHKERHGREQRVRTDIEAVQAAARILDDLEQLWRERLDRFERALDPTPDD
jgi:DNA-binding transcriptional ArsR family regulator